MLESQIFNHRGRFLPFAYDLISFLNFTPHQQYLLAKYLVCTVFDDLVRTIVPQRFNSVKNRVNAGFGSPATGNCLFASYCQVQSSLSIVSPYYLCRLDAPQPPH